MCYQRRSRLAAHLCQRMDGALRRSPNCRARHNPETRSEVWWWNLRWSFGGKCLWRFSQQKKPENLLPNFAGSSPPISPKTSPTSLWKSLVLKIETERAVSAENVTWLIRPAVTSVIWLRVFSPHLPCEIAEGNLRRFQWFSDTFSSTCNPFRLIFYHFQSVSISFNQF